MDTGWTMNINSLFFNLKRKYMLAWIRIIRKNPGPESGFSKGLSPNPNNAESLKKALHRTRCVRKQMRRAS